MTEFAALRRKTYRYSTDGDGENKKAKATKNFLNRKLKFDDYQKFLKANHLGKEIDYLEKNAFAVANPRENHKEFIKKQ